MTDKEKYDFIDHVVHLTLAEEDRLLNEHGGEYSGLEENGIDFNEYYRIITERVINILKKNNNYMQEELVSRTPADIEATMQELEEKSRAFTEAHHGEVADTILAQMRGEEPVSEDLEEAAKRYATEGDEISGLYIIDVEVEAFIAGAQWQAEQFENNRLKHCDELTEEQAQIESDFVTQHLKDNNRTPTFIDAIEYGMRLNEEQTMKDATECEVKVDAGGYPYIDRCIELYDYDKDVPLAKAGDKYKVVLIKEG